MILGEKIRQLRTDRNLSQEQVADLFGVSQQSVQKWENGDTTPELGKVIKIARYFGVSLDSLILGNDNRVVEELKKNMALKPEYNNIHDWEFYSSDLMTEFQQSVEEGLDIAEYKEVFQAVSHLPKNEIRQRLGDVLFDVVTQAPQVKDYPYNEPSDLEAIQQLRTPYEYKKNDIVDLESKIHGAWLGRVCGCRVGQAFEGIHSDEMERFLTETGNKPLHRYVYRSDFTDEMYQQYRFPFAGRLYVDEADRIPGDDDTNYTVLYQRVVEQYGRDFTPYQVSRAWLGLQAKDAYCTAERVAFCNFVAGYTPPVSAQYQNPYREWIGAQIRADYFGYINPGDPQTAAEMAWRDGCISHVKNGIYGEMFVAAMLAVAAETSCMDDIILGGLAQVPSTSRLYEQVMRVYRFYKEGGSQEDCFKMIHATYDEKTSHGWCHTVPNAMIVAASLLYGKGDYARSICMSVEACFDTDCNGATVGSILGMAYGVDIIPEYWSKPMNDTLATSIFGVGTVKISERAKMTLNHLPQK